MSGRVLFEWPKRGGIYVRVTIADYNGSQFLDIRKWLDRDGQLIATREGVTLPLEAQEPLWAGLGADWADNAPGGPSKP